MRRVFVALLVLLFAWQCLPRFDTAFRPDYRAAAATLATDNAPVLVLKEELNGRPLRYLGTPGERRLHFVESGDDLHRAALELTQGHGAVWVVMWRWDRIDAFRAHLERHGIDYGVRALDGMPPLLLWRLERAKPGEIG